jgi:hypothetical protein
MGSNTQCPPSRYLPCPVSTDRAWHCTAGAFIPHDPIYGRYLHNLTKIVHHQNKLEFRPILKSGSTFLGALLPCLQPGAWEEVHQSIPMPRGYTAVVAVREPLRRFASGLTEVMRRVFAGMCPGGPCQQKPDYYFTHGAADSADDLARHASWYARTHGSHTARTRHLAFTHSSHCGAVVRATVCASGIATRSGSTLRPTVPRATGGAMRCAPYYRRR